MTQAGLITGLHILLVTAVCCRVLLRPHRQPAARMAWIVVVLSLPFVGIAAYLLFGEVSLAVLVAIEVEQSGGCRLALPVVIIQCIA